MANNKRGGIFFSGGNSGGGFSSLLSGGKPVFFLFLAIVIGGAFLLGGGNPFPQNQLTVPDDGVYEIDEESLKDLDNARGNLQLKTIKFKECAGVTAITMMLDTTGSMETPTSKINNLKSSVLAFTSSMSDESVVGIERFNGDIGVVTEVPVSLYKDVKDIIPGRINSINPNGGTNTIEALQRARETLIQAQSAYPERNFSLIFVSDGLPNIPGGIDLSPQADPRQQNPNPADEIKNLGVTIYSIGIFGAGDTQGLTLMRDLASRPDTFYNTPNGAELENIYKSISQKICSSVQTVNN